MNSCLDEKVIISYRSPPGQMSQVNEFPERGRKKGYDDKRRHTPALSDHKDRHRNRHSAQPPTKWSEG